MDRGSGLCDILPDAPSLPGDGYQSVKKKKKAPSSGLRSMTNAAGPPLHLIGPIGSVSIDNRAVPTSTAAPHLIRDRSNCFGVQHKFHEGIRSLPDYARREKFPITASRAERLAAAFLHGRRPVSRGHNVERPRQFR